MIFALGVWIVGYQALLPVATDLPAAHRDQRRRADTTSWLA
jgi:hypothetical protein